MAQRRHHYEQAFEHYLREERIPYVAVNEARKALLPEGAAMRLETAHSAGTDPQLALKNFDFVVYGSGLNLLCEIKGRRLAPRSASGRRRATVRRLESWVHAEDVRSMRRWQHLFGPEFRAVFVFLYWCDELPGDGLFEEIVEHRGRWYALRAVGVEEYAAHMRTRSQRWNTVHVDGATFGRISHPFCRSLAGASAVAGGSAVGMPAPALEPLGA